MKILQKIKQLFTKPSYNVEHVTFEPRSAKTIIAPQIRPQLKLAPTHQNTYINYRYINNNWYDPSGYIVVDDYLLGQLESCILDDSGLIAAYYNDDVSQSSISSDLNLTSNDVVDASNAGFDIGTNIDINSGFSSSNDSANDSTQSYDSSSSSFDSGSSDSGSCDSGGGDF